MDSYEDFLEEFHAYRDQRRPADPTLDIAPPNCIADEVVNELREFLATSDEANALWENNIVPDEWGDE